MLTIQWLRRSPSSALYISRNGLEEEYQGDVQSLVNESKGGVPHDARRLWVRVRVLTELEDDSWEAEVLQGVAAPMVPRPGERVTFHQSHVHCGIV